MDKSKINVELARRLIAAQFPQWKDLQIDPVSLGGWDNRTFHLGSDMLVRMPSAEAYEPQVEKEHFWLPKLSPLLPFEVPQPIALGYPGEGYPWKWSVRRWIQGSPVSSSTDLDLVRLATDLAQFLRALHSIDTTDGPLPGFHSFYRGGPLAHYDDETRTAIEFLKDKIDVKRALQIWKQALASPWGKPNVWIHGDLSPSNLLVRNGRLSAVIDFGQMAVGDPSCDLSIYWTLFNGKSRESFRKALSLDSGTWARSRAWTLWKALITAAGITDPANVESKRCWQILEDLLS
jgi:aminoglycoside phosphotransferase (APT) family kinase protein